MTDKAASATALPGPLGSRILSDPKGSVLVEAAFAVPMLILLLTGILAFGNWFMTAHSLQQAANNAARASVAGLNTTERRALVDQSIATARTSIPGGSGQTIDVSTAESDGHYTVTLRYRMANAPLFSSLPVPLPTGDLTRSAVVRMSN